MDREKAKDVKIPYVPKSLLEKVRDLDDKEKLAMKFIEILQTHPNKGSLKFSQIEAAAQVGYEIAVELSEKFSDMSELQSKFRTLFFALFKGNPVLRLQLI